MAWAGGFWLAASWLARQAGDEFHRNATHACRVWRLCTAHRAKSKLSFPQPNMRHLTTSLLIATAALCALSPLHAQAPSPAPKAASSGGKSPHETTSVVLGERGTPTRVGITYGRPYAKGRDIWGGLVKWDTADRLGSDEATLLLTEAPLKIGDTTVQPGAYTLYIVASQTGPSKLAISSHIGKWGIPVDTKNDIARVDLTKGTINEPVEQLTIVVEKSGSGVGALKISWANTTFSVPLAIAK
jgi:hypothetical protein